MVYVTQVTTAQADETQVAMDLAEETTLPPSEAMMAIRQLRKVLLRRLLGGESVKQGNWGRYQRGRNGTQHQERQPQLPARRGIQERPPESHLRMSGQAGGR